MIPELVAPKAYTHSLLVSGVGNKVGYALDPYSDWLSIVISQVSLERFLHKL